MVITSHLIQGQDLAHMIVPAVITKLMCTIEKLEICATGFIHIIERPQTLQQFIASSKNISPLCLEIVAQDILRGEY